MLRTFATPRNFKCQGALAGCGMARRFRLRLAGDFGAENLLPSQCEVSLSAVRIVPQRLEALTRSQGVLVVWA